MQPVSVHAAGMTDARRSQIAAREMGTRGGSFAATSHPRVDHAPHGLDDREGEAPLSQRRDGRSSPLARARVRGEYPYPFDDLPDTARETDSAAVSLEKDRNVRGVRFDETDCFGRAPSPRRSKPSWQHRSNFAFCDEGTVLIPVERRAATAPNDARNLPRATSVDARERNEDPFRTLKAPGPEYAWARRDAASSDPNALWRGEKEASLRKTGRSLGPRRDFASLALAKDEERALVVGAEWASEPPKPFERTQKLGSPEVVKNNPWGVNPESVGAIQVGNRSLDVKFEDPREEERRVHEKALYESAAARFDADAQEESAKNRARCETGQAGRVLGHYLYETRGEDAVEEVRKAAEREGAARARMASPRRRNDFAEKNDSRRRDD
jgi:hypothetical protein